MLRVGLVISGLLAACGEPSDPHGDASTSHDVNIAACGSIGMACTTSCPSGLECISSGVCAPVRGDCGGFAGAQCQDTSLTCIYPAGSSGGHCMREDEKACLCAIAPSSTGDCMPP